MKVRGYNIEERIGTGGTASVYRAHQVSLDRDVAIKVLNRRLETEPCIREGFVESGRLAARVVSPYSITVYEIGFEEQGIGLEDDTSEDRGGHFFVVTELLQPDPFSERLHEMSHEAAMTAFEQVCRAVEAAHAAGVVHGDLKPHNVLFRQSGEAVLTDYLGSSCLSASDASFALASPDYMSPEQVRGEPPTQRSDIYSLGILLFELLTGRPPFSRASALDTARTRLLADIPSLHEGMTHYSALLKRMLTRDPDKRYASVAELRKDLAYMLAAFGEQDSTKTQLMPGLHEDDDEFLARLLGEEINSLEAADRAPEPTHAEVDNHLHDTQELDEPDMERESLAEDEQISMEDLPFGPDITSHTEPEIPAPPEDTEIDTQVPLEAAVETEQTPAVTGRPHFSPPTEPSLAGESIEAVAPATNDNADAPADQEAVLDLTEALDLTVPKASVEEVETAQVAATAAPPLHAARAEHGADDTALELHTLPDYAASTHSISMPEQEPPKQGGGSWKMGVVWALAASLVTSVVVVNLRGGKPGQPVDSLSRVAATEQGDHVEQTLSLPTNSSGEASRPSPSAGVRIEMPGDQPGKEETKTLTRIDAPTPAAEALVVIPSRFEEEEEKQALPASPDPVPEAARPKQVEERAGSPKDGDADKRPAAWQAEIAQLRDPAIELHDGRVRINSALRFSFQAQGLHAEKTPAGGLQVSIPTASGYYEGPARLDGDSLALLRRAAYVLRNFNGMNARISDHRFADPARSLQYAQAVQDFLRGEGVEGEKLSVSAHQGPEQPAILLQVSPQEKWLPAKDIRR